MAKRKTTEEFIADARRIHGDKYNYGQTVYASAHKKLVIVCPEHGAFEQTPGNHINNRRGCPLCGRQARATRSALTTDEFIQKAGLIHKDKYDYSRVVYKNNRTKVNIGCPQHGLFWITPANHLNNYGCAECGYLRLALWKRKPFSYFKKKARRKHGDNYEYRESDYIDTRYKIHITHKKCSTVFQQLPTDHLQGKGCPKCGGTQFKPFAQFKKEADAVHRAEYGYCKADYRNNKTPIRMVHKFCGTCFTKTPTKHLRGHGCPRCRESRGEKRITNFLIKQGCVFERQKKFLDCRRRSPLSFDFVLSSTRVLIEYQGEQHYLSIKRWGGKNNFKLVKERDSIKKRWARKNGWRLICIPYTVKNIEAYLNKRLKPLQSIAKAA